MHIMHRIIGKRFVFNGKSAVHDSCNRADSRESSTRLVIFFCSINLIENAHLGRRFESDLSDF